MQSSQDLDMMGLTLAEEYISEAASLTEGLVKVGSANGLNRQQINRIAEAANVETYLKLQKIASDKYIKFPLADASKAYRAIADPTFKSAEYTDYDEPIEKQASDDSVYNLYRSIMPEDSFITEQPVINRESEFRKQAQYIEGVLQHLNDAFYTSQARIDSKLTDVGNFIKQAILNDTSFEDVTSILKTACPIIADFIKEDCKRWLENDAPHKDLEKKATHHNPNPKSKMFNIAKELQLEVVRMVKLGEAIETYETKLIEVAKEGHLLKNAGKVLTYVSEGVKGVGQMVKKHKGLTIGIVAAGLTYQGGKRTGRREQGVLLQKEVVKQLKRAKANG